MTNPDKSSPSSCTETLLTSSFGNTYGVLSMVRDSEGDLFLKMEDCSGDDYHGPLTPIEAAAFTLLAEAY